MARRSRSRRDRRSPRPGRGPQLASTSIGRRLESASRRLRLLPRSLPVGLLTQSRTALRPTLRFAAPRFGFVLRGVGRRTDDAQSLRERYRRSQRYYNSVLRRPVLRRETSFCSRRERRRQVLHARGVAGVGGGAWRFMMLEAKHSVSSAFSCRR